MNNDINNNRNQNQNNQNNQNNPDKQNTQNFQNIQDIQDILNPRKNQNNQPNNSNQRQPGQNPPQPPRPNQGQNRQNQGDPLIPLNQSRPPQPQKPGSDPARRNPNPMPPNSAANPNRQNPVMRNPNNNNGDEDNDVKIANMIDDFDSTRTPFETPPIEPGQTRTFDTNPNLTISPNPTRNVRDGQSRDGRVRQGQPRDSSPQQNKDGTYHYTGRNIKSNRQMFVDPNRPTPNQNPGKQNTSTRRRPVNEYDDDSEMTVSANKDKKKNKNKEEAEDSKRGGFIMSGIIKVLLYIIGVLLVSIIIAYNMIMVANDVFAFVKESEVVVVTIPENADIERISQILSENGLIKYPKVFNLYITIRKKDKVWNKQTEEYVPVEFESGEYPVSSTLNYDEFLATFRKKAAERESVRISIPEGWSIDQIITRFVDEYGVGSRAKFVEVINHHDFSVYGYKFLKPLYETQLSPDRKYKLEGYLFPDTYDFYKDENEVNIIIKFLDNFNEKFNEDLYKQCETLDKIYMEKTGRHFTLDDVMILASIIEREGKFWDDFPKISAVFQNRLIYSASFPFLNSDATKLYDYAEHKSDLTGEDLLVDSPYNTYTRKGLPPSAICNPGYEAITAALQPEEDSPYFFFVTNLEGRAYFGRTSAEHEQNIRNYRGK
jgi:UPF0755 protein